MLTIQRAIAEVELTDEQIAAVVGGQDPIDAWAREWLSFLLNTPPYVAAVQPRGSELSPYFSENPGFLSNQ